MAEPADVFLARNLGRLSRMPEPVFVEQLRKLDALDSMLLEMAFERLEAVEHFTPLELDFFARGEEEERILLESLDG
jgi:hypothetical protein